MGFGETPDPDVGLLIYALGSLTLGGFINMKPVRNWLKFSGLIAFAIALAIGFAAAVDLPEDSFAQDARRTSLLTAQAVQQAPVIPEARPLAELGGAFAAVAEAVRPTVVFITVDRQAEQGRRSPGPFDRFFEQPDNQPPPREITGSGSGFVISPDGYILTNNHVIEGAEYLIVKLFDQREFQAEVVGRDPDTDIAVIKIAARNLPVASFGDSDSATVGEWVLAIGNPLGEAFSFTVTAGIVSGRGRRLASLQPLGPSWSIHDFIQTDAAINPGNSGGPLVNIRGQVIGVNAAIASRTGYYSGAGFAIPINLAQNVADQLIANGRVMRAALGVLIGNASQEDAEYVGLKKIRGVVISNFAEGESAARESGLEKGDVIVSVDGKRVDYTAQLQQLIGFKRPGDVANITVMRRGGEQHTYPVKLGARDDPAETVVAVAGPEDSDAGGSVVHELGISVEPIDEGQIRQSRFDRALPGLLVTDVDRHGPSRSRLATSAPRQGFFEIITHVENERVYTRDDLDNALRDYSSGDIVSITVRQVSAQTVTERPVRIKIR